MGLRSRQRRLAGVSEEDSYDPEATRHRSQSLEEHLRASIDDVDAFNLMWKKTIAYAGLVLAVYEVILLYQMLSQGNGLQPLCLGLKLMAFTSIFCTREYVSTGHAPSLGRSVFFSASYALTWVCCVAVLGQRFSVVQVSPFCLLYFAASLCMLQLIGGNTQAEAARAQQLDKLQHLMGGVGA